MIKRLTVREAFEARFAHYRNRVLDSDVQTVARQMRKQGYSVEQAAAILASKPAAAIQNVAFGFSGLRADKLCVGDLRTQVTNWRISTMREVDERGFVSITQIDEHCRPIQYERTS